MPALLSQRLQSCFHPDLKFLNWRVLLALRDWLPSAAFGVLSFTHCSLYLLYYSSHKLYLTLEGDVSLMLVMKITFSFSDLWMSSTISPFEYGGIERASKRVTLRCMQHRKMYDCFLFSLSMSVFHYDVVIKMGWLIIHRCVWSVYQCMVFYCLSFNLQHLSLSMHLSIIFWVKFILPDLWFAIFPHVVLKATWKRMTMVIQS